MDNRDWIKKAASPEYGEWWQDVFPGNELL